MTALRCHLLIGPPASGKTTLAMALAEITGAVVLSTDQLRDQLFGDAAVQGPWVEIEALLHQRIQASVAEGIPVIVDATHARRPWRLAITQALKLPAPVEWIGWWLYTPLATCLEWNQTRQRLVPEPVIREMAAALADQNFGPQRSEGFAAVVAVVPPSADELPSLLGDELARLDRRIRAASNREQAFERHGYSRLLDLERLYLLKLRRFTPSSMSAIPPIERSSSNRVSLAEGDLAERAATFCGSSWNLFWRCRGHSWRSALARGERIWCLEPRASPVIEPPACSPAAPNAECPPW